MSVDNATKDISETISKPMSPIKALVKFLDKVHGAVGEYSEDTNGAFKCMFFQDSSMKDIFNFYPDRICLDFTFHRFETDLFILTFICEDSNGRNFIVAVSFLQNNDEESLVWLFNAFKKHNPNWRKIKIMFVDFEIKPPEIVRDSFPQHLKIICAYHAIKSFEKDLNNMAMNSVQGDNKAAAVDSFKKLILASNQSDFELYYQQLHLFPEPFFSYFSEIMEPRLNEWRIPLDYAHENIFSNLNLFLEHYNDVLVSLFGNEVSYIEFIKKLFSYISLKKKEKPSLSSHVISILYSRFSPEYQISKTLTPYAAEFVIKQLDLSSEIHLNVNTPLDVYTFDFLGYPVTASSFQCSCNFFTLTSLPCRHIFAVRRSNYVCVFDESQIGYTWKLSYYEHSVACMKDHLTHKTGCCIPQDFQSRKTFSSHLLEVNVKNLLEVPKEVFQERLAVLKRLANAWEHNDDVSLLFKGIEKRKEATAEAKNDAASSSEIIPPCDPEPINEPSCSSKPDPSSSVSNISVEDKELEQPSTSPLPVRNLSPLPVRNLRRPGLVDFGTWILNAHRINMAYICCMLCFTKESCVEWLKSKELIPTSMQCPQCEAPMVSRTVLRLSDGVVWLCPKTGESKKGCGKRCSVRMGTWFEKMNMTLEQSLIFSYLWVYKFSRQQIVRETCITSSLFVSCDKFHRRVCEESLKKDDQKRSSPSSRNPVDKWLQKQKHEDKFLAFLKEARRIHEEGAAKDVEDKMK